MGIHVSFNRDKSLEKDEYLNEVRQQLFRAIKSTNLDDAIINGLRKLYFNDVIPTTEEVVVEIEINLAERNALNGELFKDKEFLNIFFEYLDEENKKTLFYDDGELVLKSVPGFALDNNDFYQLKILYLLKKCDEDFLFDSHE